MKHQKESKAGTCPDTPLWDSSLPVEERLDALLEAMTGEEKLKCLTTGCPDIPRLGIRSFHLGGEAAHGIERATIRILTGESLSPRPHFRSLWA